MNEPAPLHRLWSAVRSRAPLTVVLTIWALVVAVGLIALVRYSLRPGVPAVAPRTWPSETRVARVPGRPSLVMIAHPHCVCTRASVGELAVLMTRVGSNISATVLFVLPPGTSREWGETDLQESAAEIPGVTVFVDDGGREAKRFGASTSGQVLLYDVAGRLRYSGGITDGRGSAGDNPGRTALQAQIIGRPAGVAKSPVFGCELFNPHARE